MDSFMIVSCSVINWDGMQTILVPDGIYISDIMTGKEARRNAEDEIQRYGLRQRIVPAVPGMLDKIREWKEWVRSWDNSLGKLPVASTPTERVSETTN